MSLPKEPRQLMINLMYLVLTALLAMNVSSEILNAFKIVDTSIQHSNDNISNRSNTTIDNFQIGLDDPKIIADEKKFNKVKVCMGYAKEAVAMRQELEKEILVYREMIIKRAGGIDPETKDVMRRDDLDAATAVMIEDDRKGPEMLAKLQKFKSAIAALVPISTPGPGDPTGEDNLTLPSKNDSLEKELPLNFNVLESEENTKKDWSYGNFHMVPAVGALTIIDKYINDIRNSESIVIDKLWLKAFGARRTKEPVFTNYDVLVSSPNTYLLPGEKYTATIMLGAYNKKASNLKIMVNGNTLPVVDGIATYTAIATGKGEQKLSVSASYTDPNDLSTKSVPVKPYSYYVGEAQASISLDKMNVFYIGVDNPITLAASGVPAGSLNYTPENCTMTKAEGINKFMVTVAAGTAGTKAKIKLSGKLGDGTTKDFGVYEYRIKNIPDPYPVIAGRRGGNISKSELSVQEAIFAKLDNFDFDVKFKVTGFDVNYQNKGTSELSVGKGTNQYLTGPNADKDVADIMKNLKVGSKIYFESIKAVGPDGRTRNIGSVNLTINN